MSPPDFIALRNAQAVPRSRISDLPFARFRELVVDAVSDGQRVAALFGDVAGSSGKVELYVVLADRTRALLRIGKTTLDEDRFPSLTTDCAQVHLFEREVAEQYGVRPVGHPWFKPVRFHESFRPGHDAWDRARGVRPVIGVTDYFRVEGEEIHEVAVGPVHAGVIEPGHFRFQCHGEHVFHLEISLGYQYRGAERTLVGGPNKRTLHTMETLAGDTSVGHATAYSQAVEALAGRHVTVRAEALRGIALELERLANHTGDLGALAGDVGFLPSASYCGRLRGDFLNLTALLCGNRFGRGLVRPGGVGFDLDEARRQECPQRLESAVGDVANAADLLWNSTSVQARFEGTGTVSTATAEALGLVGPAARACGLENDVRHDFPAGIFRFAQVPVSSWTTGDVFARAYVRWLEIQRSAAFIKDELQAFPEGPIRVELGPLKADHVVVSLVEGWRGEICHVALTDAAGRFSRYKVVDPSFHNWTGLALALRNQQISDFPLCNKSFNLSYCGHDL
ncbi:MAG: NADH-quinone oxidoreductase subunit C [Paludisphaera borealis]|uniref:hydrogenase large subunit n=1 Tax=Paludisphaera borealis TaxID=1387353 RepID=UPI0028484FDF|nr:NADH-quinone oxidoreductase subunit C [Paludisphaera borealis]MDR3618600.1 NADH-quinone oxidoreductase subunit C [Paludisphaera borealis]